MNRFFPALTALLVAALFAFASAAATTTTPVSLSSTTFTDLGAGPMLLGAAGGDIVYQIADSQPPASAPGLLQSSGTAPASLQVVTAHVWARSMASGVALVSSGTGVTSLGGGAGGSTPTGVAGTPNAAVVSVQGVSGGTPQPVAIASLPALAAGSSTVGNVGINNNAVGPASFVTTQASITTTSSVAALAARAGAVGTGRVSVTIYNTGSVTAYLGTSTSVTSSTGLPILPGGSYTKRTTAALYAVTASGSTTLAFDEEF